MTQERINSFSGADCVDDEDCQTYVVPRTSISNDHTMLACSRLNNHDQHALPLLPGNPFNPSFAPEPNYTSLAYRGAGIPTNYQQFAYHPQHDFSSVPANLGYLSSTRSSMQLSPLCGTMEPQMMLRHDGYLPVTQPSYFNHNFAMSTSACSPDMMSATTASPSLSFSYGNEQFYPDSIWQPNLQAFQLPDGCSTASASDGLEDEDGGVYDKPYAQLIYDALKEAPGHRMLLRDIYDWFLQNTRKPQESGTNGWQNSIRHNLSMNQVRTYTDTECSLLTQGQAFENDKNDPASSRGARKANSVWVLTEYAIKHGVQSTTRYRKTGTAKKGVSNRVPAIQRQQSGAKGGRAARRAARLKRQGEDQRRAKTVPPEIETPTSFGHSGSPLSIAQDHWSSYSCSPTTPAEDQYLSTTYSLPHRSYYEYDQEMGPKQGTDSVLYEEEQLRQMLSQSAASDTEFEDNARP